MTMLTIEIPLSLYERLRLLAQQRQTSVEHVAQTLLQETVAEQHPGTERERVTQALRTAGLLVEPSAAMRDLAAESTLTLDDARAILDRAGGQPLSELILEMRGPKP